MCVRAAAATARYEGYELRAIATSCYELRATAPRMQCGIARLLSTTAYYLSVPHGATLSDTVRHGATRCDTASCFSPPPMTTTQHTTLYTKCTYLHSVIADDCRAGSVRLLHVT